MNAALVFTLLQMDVILVRFTASLKLLMPEIVQDAQRIPLLQKQDHFRLNCAEVFII